MKKWIVLGIIALLLLGLAGGFFFTHCRIDGKLVYRNARSLDLSHRKIQDIDKICELKNLKDLNLEGTNLTIDQYETLHAALPDCDIRWQVPFQGGFFDPDTASVTVSALSQEDIRALDYLPQLSFVDAADCRDYEALALLQSRHPGCTISYTVAIGGQVFPYDAASLEVSTGSLAEIDSALALLPNLESITVSGCADALGLKALSEKYPNCRFIYDISVGSQTFPSNAVSITLAPEELRELQAVLPCFQSLTDVTFTGSAPEAHALADAYPDIAFHYGFRLFGLDVHTDQEFLDLSGIKMKDTQELEAAFPYFHNLTKVDMLNCGLKNEVLGALNERYPQTQFVWQVLIGERYYRTDITYFYPAGSNLSMENVDISNLQYCTELVVLDLGHFGIRDCSFVEKMPKLEYLVLAIGPLKDIRPIGTLKELKFLELFDTRVTDYWPLVNCTKLEALNLSFSRHGDVTPLLQMPWLTHLWLVSGREIFSEEERAALTGNLPNTIIIFSSHSSTDKGWRNTPGYYAMRDILHARYLID